VYTRVPVESSRVLRRSRVYVDLIHGTYVCYLLLLLAGQLCSDWQPWGKYFGIGSILGQSLLQSISYILLSVRAFPRCVRCAITSIRLQTAFASSAAVLVISYAP
jgi:hypothetical protein